MDDEQSAGRHEEILIPLRSACPPGSATSSCKTQTGRRCNLLACLETLPGVHFSNGPCCRALASSGNPDSLFTGISPPFSLSLNSQILCPSVNRTSDTTAFLYNHNRPGGLIVSSPSPSPFPSRPCLRPRLLIMPRLRQRMRARRGVSRGLRSDIPPSPLSELSSSSDGDDLTPPPPSRGGRRRGRGRATLAGRGRGQARAIGNISGRPDAHHAPPCHSSPPDIHAPPRQPLSPDDSAPPSHLNSPGSRLRGSTIRQTTQNAELRFHCTSFDSIITALITVSLREEIPLSVPPSAPPDPSPNPSLHLGACTEAEHQKEKSDSLAGKEDGSTGDEYACRIEEEPMSSEQEG